MAMKVQRISAVTFRVADMSESVRFYRDVLGMEIIYGGEGEFFSSLRTEDAPYPILNLEHGEPATRWGRLIFHLADVDAFWAYLRGEGFHPENPRDASWGEPYFHMSDPATSCRLRARSKDVGNIMQADEGRMAVLMEMHHADPLLRSEVVAAIEHVLADKAGDWSVSVVGSRTNDRWEMKITGPNGFERSYTLREVPGNIGRR
jgi:catechol 2,3-dioxygenase-like lactoylglutathione lyase family enzyme